jgi:ParB family chromosome partitioning protein
LADSIAQCGVIEPIVVKPIGKGFYRIVAGERRWRASRIAQLSEVPVIIRDDLSELDTFQLSFTENLQRQSLTPIEEALGFQRMSEEFHLTQEEISKRTGRSRPSVANIVRLLKLPQSVQDMIADGSLPVAHAKLILSADAQYHERLAKLTVENGLSVKQLEYEINRLHTQPKVRKRKRLYVETELSLRDILNRPIRIDGSNKKGTITLEFYGEDDLKTLANRLADLVDK